MRLKKYFVHEQLEFDGQQLKAHWAQQSFGLKGESIVAFVGLYNPGREVSLPAAFEIFRNTKLLHLVVEHLHADLEKLHLQQLLLLSVLQDKLNHRLKGDLVQRWGQNLCHESARLTASKSLLTASSALIYTGVNVHRGDPKSKLWGLEEGGIDPEELAQVVMDQYIFELEGIRRQKD
jgi:hypothetical protein